LPAGVLHLRSQHQTFSVHIIDPQGASRQGASVDMEELGLQAVSNVRRSFDLRVGTIGIQVFIDGASVINASYRHVHAAAGRLRVLWVAFG
jgi:hypothetical protein